MDFGTFRMDYTGIRIDCNVKANKSEAGGWGGRPGLSGWGRRGTVNVPGDA